MSMTLTDGLSHGTYLLDNDPGNPMVICLSYAWMINALKVPPLSATPRADLALTVWAKFHPTADIGSHIQGDPITLKRGDGSGFPRCLNGCVAGELPL